MNRRCQRDDPSTCHRSYCLRTGRCADDAASEPVTLPAVPPMLPRTLVLRVERDLLGLHRVYLPDGTEIPNVLDIRESSNIDGLASVTITLHNATLIHKS